MIGALKITIAIHILNIAVLYSCVKWQSYAWQNILCDGNYPK